MAGSVCAPLCSARFSGSWVTWKWCCAAWSVELIENDRKWSSSGTLSFHLNIFLGSERKTTMEWTNTTKGINNEAFRSLMCVFSYWSVSLFWKSVSVGGPAECPLVSAQCDGRAMLKYTEKKIHIFENGHVTTKFLQFLSIFCFQWTLNH